MNGLKKIVKSFLRKGLLVEAVPTTPTADIYKNLPPDFMSERTFYFGLKRMRVRSLVMESAPGTAEVVIQLLKKTIMAGSQILDFGCGQHQSRYLKNIGFKVYSCDILDFKMDNFTKLDPASDKLPFSDGQFDVVIASEVLEHLESPWAILKELARVAKRSVIVTTPNPACLKSRWQFLEKRFLYWFAPENFEYHINPIFWWQVELFCKRYNLTLGRTLSNHQAFKLDDKGEVLDFAETLIYKIDKINV